MTKMDYVMAIVVLLEEGGHPSSSYIPYHYEWYDDDGYDHYEPAIALHLGQIETLSKMFDIPLDRVKEMVLAHERGHAYAHCKQEDLFDEELAWKYAYLFYEGIDPRLREHCLESYR